MPYTVSSTPGVFVDHDALSHLIDECTKPGVRAVLVGFGEYAKHIVNLCPVSVAAIYDPNPLFSGEKVKFRGIPVLDLPKTVDANLIVGCEYHTLYEYLGDVVRAFGWLRYYYPPRLANKETELLNIFEQEQFYQTLLKNERGAPVSMMNREKMRLLVELLRTGLALSSDANVLEMGSWQGGSAWYIAKSMKILGGNRSFYMMDLFELHQMDPTATMCTDEVVLRMAAVYDKVKLIIGLADDEQSLAQVKGPLCFAHIDLGYQEPSLRFAWDNLIRGAPLLLDNYGHLRAPTWKFDDFFASRGTRVVRLPWSEQGLVFKN